MLASVCRLRAVISEEEADNAEWRGINDTEILEGDKGCCHRTSGGLAFNVTVSVARAAERYDGLTDIFEWNKSDI